MRRAIKPQFPNGMVSSVSFVSITNTARSLAGFVLPALALTALVRSQHLPSSYARTFAGSLGGAAAVKSAADQLDYLSGITSSRWLVSTTKTASSFAGAVVLAFRLTW